MKKVLTVTCTNSFLKEKFQKMSSIFTPNKKKLHFLALSAKNEITFKTASRVMAWNKKQTLPCFIINDFHVHA